MIIKNYKYDYSGGKIYYTIDVDGYEQAMEHTKTEYGSVQRNDIDDFLKRMNKKVDYQAAASLVKAGALDTFGYNRATLMKKVKLNQVL